MVIFFARGLIQTFIIRSDELELLFDLEVLGVCWGIRAERHPGVKTFRDYLSQFFQIRLIKFV